VDQVKLIGYVISIIYRLRDTDTDCSSEESEAELVCIGSTQLPILGGMRNE